MSLLALNVTCRNATIRSLPGVSELVADSVNLSKMTRRHIRDAFAECSGFRYCSYCRGGTGRFPGLMATIGPADARRIMNSSRVRKSGSAGFLDDSVRYFDPCAQSDNHRGAMNSKSPGRAQRNPSREAFFVGCYSITSSAMVLRSTDFT